MFLSGCTNIQIYEKDGTIKTEKEYGVLKIEITPRSSAQTIHYSGIGMVNTPLANSYGIHKADFVALPENDCRVIIYADSNAQLSLLKDLLDSNGDICSVSY